MHGLILETKLYYLRNITGTTHFKGCQCYKNCTCNEDFITVHYSYYTVKRKTGRCKTTIHNTLEEAKDRCKFLDKLCEESNLNINTK